MKKELIIGLLLTFGAAATMGECLARKLLKNSLSSEAQEFQSETRFFVDDSDAELSDDTSEENDEDNEDNRDDGDDEDDGDTTATYNYNAVDNYAPDLSSDYTDTENQEPSNNALVEIPVFEGAPSSAEESQRFEPAANSDWANLGNNPPEQNEHGTNEAAENGANGDNQEITNDNSPDYLEMTHNNSPYLQPDKRRHGLPAEQ